MLTGCFSESHKIPKIIKSQSFSWVSDSDSSSGLTAFGFAGWQLFVVGACGGPSSSTYRREMTRKKDKGPIIPMEGIFLNDINTSYWTASLKGDTISK